MLVQRQEAKALFPLLYVLPLVILIEGFVSIAVEILTIRQLLPVAGGSVIVTSLIIGIFLLFLALGYQRGGKPHADPRKVLRKNFFIAALWLGIGLSYLFVGVFFALIQKITGPHVVYPLMIYLLLIIAPLIYILGQTVPITMNMVKQNYPAGTIGGNTLGLSTLGSFLGAIITTLVLMYFFGVAWTVLTVFCLLLVLVLVMTENRSSFFNHLAIALLTIALIYIVNVKIEQGFFVHTNNYANYQILDHHNSKLREGDKMLVINDAYSSYINPYGQGFPYIEAMKKILFEDLKLHDANILVLGAGGFTLSTNNVHQNKFTYVDIDKKIKEVAVPQFLEQLNSPLIQDDARHYLLTTDKTFDAIVIDAYSDIKSIPAHLLTREYVEQIKHRLVPNGVAIFNIVANPMLKDAYSKRIDNTIRSVFTHCMVIPMAYVNQASNILYTCTNPETQSDKVIYSDNLNNSTTDSFAW